MRYQSLSLLVSKTWSTARRFPVAIGFAAAATFGGWGMIDESDIGRLPARLFFSALLGLPLAVALTALSERRTWGTARRVLAEGAVIAVIAVFFLLWPAWTQVGRLTRFFHLAVAANLLAVFLPFVGPAQILSFWRYNRDLFLRFLWSAGFALVFFLSLVLGLLALENLFRVEVPEEAYGRAWMIAAFLFHPWHFLAGFPKNLTNLRADDEYPTLLRVFAQYLLVPISTVYLLILNGYVARVLILREWPVRWLGYLIAGAVAVGLLAILLLHPLQIRREHRWIATFTRAFFWLLVPSALALLVALGRRIAAYGVTERRYLLAMLTLWLLGTALFFAVTRSRNIKLIPSSLAVLALVTAVGPWSAYGISRFDQRQRLERDLRQLAMLDADGAVRRPDRALSPEEEERLSDRVFYLLEGHGLNALRPQFDAVISRHEQKLGRPRYMSQVHQHARLIVEDLGLTYRRVTRGVGPARDLFSYWAAPDDQALEIAGYDYLVRVVANRGAEPTTIMIGTAEYQVTLEGDRVLLRHGEDIAAAATTRPLVEQLRATVGLQASRPLGRAELRASLEGPTLRGVLFFQNLAGEAPDDEVALSRIDAELAVSATTPE